MKYKKWQRQKTGDSLNINKSNFLGSSQRYKSLLTTFSFGLSWVKILPSLFFAVLISCNVYSYRVVLSILSPLLSTHKTKKNVIEKLTEKSSMFFGSISRFSWVLIFDFFWFVFSAYLWL